MIALDRIIEALFPGWALRREKARAALSMGRSQLEAANTMHRLRAEAISQVPTPAQLRNKRLKILSTARSLDLKNAWYHGLMNALPNNIVGDGFCLESNFRRGEERDPDTNRAIEEAFEAWAGAANVQGTRSFNDILWELDRELWVAGEALLVRVTPPPGGAVPRDVPLALDFVTSERLWDEDRELPEGGRIAQGVEFNRANEVVAYHILPRPLGTEVSFTSALDAQRVPADRVIHVFQSIHPDDVRGLSSAAAVGVQFEALAQYLDHEIVRARIASSFALMIKKRSMTTSLAKNNAPETDAHGNPISNVEGGLVLYGGPEDSIESTGSAVQTANLAEFVETILRSVSTGMNVSYEVLARDYSRTNFSSARQSSLEDRKHWRPRQNRLVKTVAARVWSWFLESAIVAGQQPFVSLDLAELQKSAVWRTPGWEWIDPVKEVRAAKEAVKAGFASPQEVVAKTNGKSFFRVLEEIREAKDAADQAGVSLDTAVEQEAEPSAPSVAEAVTDAIEDNAEDQAA